MGLPGNLFSNRLEIENKEKLKKKLKIGTTNLQSQNHLKKRNVSMLPFHALQSLLSFALKNNDDFDERKFQKSKLNLQVKLRHLFAEKFEID